MATYDSADLLSLFNQKAFRPATDAITDAQKYARLAKAQNRVIALMAGVVPYSLYPKVAYGSIPTLTTTDNQIFTFGTDSNGYPIYPMGKAGIYSNLNDIPDFPWAEGQDYISEGYQIRIPNNNSYTGTLYWYGIGQPADISASTQPSLFPEASRELIVIEAVRQFALEGVRNKELADAMRMEWHGTRDEPGAWPIWCLCWRTQFKSGGALNCFTGMQLALAGGYLNT